MTSAEMLEVLFSYGLKIKAKADFSFAEGRALQRLVSAFAFDDLQTVNNKSCTFCFIIYIV